jgi:PAS domain S-box-containing protein
MYKIYKDDISDEWYFPDNAFILSETDSHGNILYVNDLFCDIAGYGKNELIGQAHNIVRHSDMPRIAFKGLWDDIKSKGFWSGIVKNLRKDHGYYWVRATVLRKIDHDGTIKYLSVRVKPSRLEIESSDALYRKLREQE